MSGHSKWSSIKRKKGAADAKRGKIFTQLIREIAVAARTSGGSPDANPRLRLAIEKARAQNMPKENIERAIKRGTGELEGASYEEVRYEGYGPGGVAVIVDAVTDNRTRTVSDVRHQFTKYGGNLGASGCVAYLFEKKGLLVFERANLDAEALLEAAIEANALDVQEDAQSIEVQTSPEAFAEVQQALVARGFSAQSAEVLLLPQTTVRLTGRDAQAALKLYEALDDHEDVKQVYANFDIADDELMEVARAG